MRPDLKIDWRAVEQVPSLHAEEAGQVVELEQEQLCSGSVQAVGVNLIQCSLLDLLPF